MIYPDLIIKKQLFKVIRQVKAQMLGIYTWILFIANHPEKVFSLAKNYSDSAFCIFCKAEDISAEFLDEASELYNIMIVIQYEENAAVICDTIRKMGLLYSVWYQYGQKDAKSIINGDLFSSIQQLSPVFTFFLPESNCSETTKTVVYQAILQARNEQRYHTLLWDLHGDNSLIDSIISDDSCSTYFDAQGNFCVFGKKIESEHHNLFQNSLSEILINKCAKKVEVSV